MKALVEGGCNVNSQTASGENILMLYVERALVFDPDFVRYLIKSGFDCKVLNKEVYEMVKQLGNK